MREHIVHRPELRQVVHAALPPGNVGGVPVTPTFYFTGLRHLDSLLAAHFWLRAGDIAYPTWIQLPLRFLLLHHQAAPRHAQARPSSFIMAFSSRCGVL